MTPNDIEILIHCYVSPAPHPRQNSPGVAQTLEDFVAMELVTKKKEGIYLTTEKGAAHVVQLCSVPFPEKQFIGYDGKVIKDP